MLRKLASPRRGSRFAGSAAPPTQAKHDANELSSVGGEASAPKSPAASPTKKRFSMWGNKAPPSATDAAPATGVPALRLDGGVTDAESKTVGSIQEIPDGDEKHSDVSVDGTSGKPSPLLRTPRQRAILESENKPEDLAGSSTTKPSPLVRTPREKAILDVADAKPSTSKVDTDEKKKPRTKRDSLGLKSLMARRDKGDEKQHKPLEVDTRSTPESDDLRAAKPRDEGVGTAKKKQSDETPDPPLSPIRRKPRSSTDGLSIQPSANATIREATSMLARKSVTRLDGVPPMQQPEVHIIGELVGGDGFGKASDGYCCKWSVDYGNQWIHVAGDQIGQTQIDYSDALPPDEGSVVWAHPIDLHFATTALHGWPKLLLQVWRVDSHMKMNVVGYGFVHLPFAPGFHRLTVSMWRPMGTSKEELGATLLGHTPELLTDEVLFNTAWAERCRLKTIATGRVHVSIGIIVRNFDAGVAHMDM